MRALSHKLATGYRPEVRITRCPRCLAEDITADAHPSRRLVDLVLKKPWPAMLRGFYKDRARESPDDGRVTAALQEVERRLLIGPVERASRVDV